MDPRWPAVLWTVRHGQSAAGPGRTADLPLTRLGQEQSDALGRWFAAMPAADRPGLLLTSPHRCARQTAERIAEAGGLPDPDVEIAVDERLRDRELGLLVGLSASDVEERFPEQAALRQTVGELYYRPPGGESWCDVLLRLRHLVDGLSLHHAGRRVLLVTHEGVVIALRYVLEGLTEEELLAGARGHGVAHCAVTSYLAEVEGLELERFNFVAPLLDAGAPVTRRREAPVAAAEGGRPGSS